MSPEWIPLLFAAAVIVLLLLLLRPRGQSSRMTICRILVMEAAYLSMCYLLSDVLQHPPVEVLMGSILVAALAGAIPKRYYRMLARERSPARITPGCRFAHSAYNSKGRSIIHIFRNQGEKHHG